MRKITCFALVALCCYQLFTSCSKKNEDFTGSIFERLGKVRSLESLEARKLAYGMLSAAERSSLWEIHLKTAVATLSLTREQIGIIEEGLSFIKQSTSTNNGSGILDSDKFEIWRYKASTRFSASEKAYLFNDIRAEQGKPNLVMMNPPLNCECHQTTDFCSNRNYTVLFCVHSFYCESTGCTTSESGCGWLWLESCNGGCKEYTAGAC